MSSSSLWRLWWVFSLTVVYCQLFSYGVTHNNNHTPFCGISSLFHGTWEYVGNISVGQSIDPFQSCPNAFNDIAEQFWIENQRSKYGCRNHSYQAASFRQSCSILPLGKTIAKLKDKKIVFVGDSLVGQLFIAAKCVYDCLGFQAESKNLDFHFNTMLRPDMPCHPECAKNHQFRTKDYLVPCAACPKGIVYEFNSFMPSYPDYWMSQVNNETDALIIGTGAWYNFRKFLGTDPIGIYKETIDGLAPYFHRFVHEMKIKVFWVNLPPILETDLSLVHWYGWDNFAFYDEYAKQRLSGEGVIFIDSNHAVAERKRKDPAVSFPSGELHWCNPGRSSVPEFTIQAIFHLLALSFHEEKPID
jgi:hypothetical protein